MAPATSLPVTDAPVTNAAGGISILVYVGLDLIGDGLMKLPFLRALRAAFPAAHITWLAGKGRTVYAHELAPLTVGLLNETIENAGIGSRFGELFETPLAGRRFDLVIDTQRRVLTTLIVKRIAHGRFISAGAGYMFSDAAPTLRAKPPTKSLPPGVKPLALGWMSATRPRSTRRCGPAPSTLAASTSW